MKIIFYYTFIIFIFFLIMPIIFFISVIILVTSGFPIIHWSKRIGIDDNVFYMAKFRTMKKNTPQLATHLLEDPNKHLTGIGRFLRKLSLDELPQIINLLKLEMMLVGPRPALYNQYDLIEKRRKKNINKIKPGITGLAQISGRDEMSIDKKVDIDYKYMINKSFKNDAIIVLKTIYITLIAKNISH